jgi:hypothetical protein
MGAGRRASPPLACAGQNDESARNKANITLSIFKIFDPYRAAPRFQALLAKMNLA